MIDVWDDVETETESEACEYSADSADSADDSASGPGQSSATPATPAGISQSPRTGHSVSYDWQEVTAGKQIIHICTQKTVRF